MGTSPQSSPSPPHQYPEAIQLKLYQAFIFSIPILFSIILFLLFYLFYLKRRSSSSPPILPRTLQDTTHFDSDLKNETKNKLCTVLFDEYMQARDPICCVCLGEFEVKEELVQVASCNHIFHTDCIRHWLRTNSTCPLCRAPVLSEHTDPSKILSTPPEYTQSHHHPTAAPPDQIQYLQHYCMRPELGSSSSSSSSTGTSYINHNQLIS